MQEEVPQVTIGMADLRELAKVNPLAWEQLMHIADTRILKARIAELENGTTAHEIAHS